jgi:hypothetical protein
VIWKTKYINNVIKYQWTESEIHCENSLIANTENMQQETGTKKKQIAKLNFQTRL